jgi:hypothetical protein
VKIVYRITHGMEARVSRVQLILMLRLDRPQDRSAIVHAILGTQEQRVEIARRIIFLIVMALVFRVYTEERRRVQRRYMWQGRVVHARPGTQGYGVIRVRGITDGMVPRVSRVRMEVPLLNL